jgi:hypothetical protein
VKEANLGLRFVLELCLLVAIAYDGLQLNVVVAVLAPLVLVLFWRRDDTDTSHVTA